MCRGKVHSPRRGWRDTWWKKSLRRILLSERLRADKEVPRVGLWVARRRALGHTKAVEHILSRVQRARYRNQLTVILIVHEIGLSGSGHPCRASPHEATLR